jgi:hypothetical protein
VEPFGAGGAAGGAVTASAPGRRRDAARPWAAGIVRAAAEVAGRPSLWPDAVREAARLVPPGWWRSAPRLPLPDPGYVRFRLHTAYGQADHPPGADDVVAWLRWCGRMRVLSRQR